MKLLPAQMSTTLTLVFDAAQRVKAVQIPKVVVMVVKGTDNRRQATFSSERILIGNSDEADFPVPDKAVSQTHCELRPSGESVRIVDLGSKNGVWVNERRVRDLDLQSGDSFQIGNTRLSVKIDGHSELTVEDRTSLGHLLGGSVAMRLLYTQLARAAASDASVLLLGETGTGKELVAETLVELSRRAKAPHGVIDCATSSSDLFEAEIRGYEAGAFSGAAKRFVGAFERNDGGTLLLDNIDELPLELQPKLLGVLERGEVLRLGATDPVKFDVRILATSSRPLEPLVNQGLFRADLFFRLAAIQLQVPRLDERRDDVPQLVGHFLHELGSDKPIPATTLTQLYDAPYPGNVRELRNAVERVVAGLAVAPTSTFAGDGKSLELSVDQPFWSQREALWRKIEQQYLVRLLDSCRDNLAEAARRSKISRVRLYQMLRQHGISRG